MSYILRSPKHVSLFSRKRRSKPTPPLLELLLFLYASAVAGCFGFVAAKFGDIAFNHPHDPHAMAGMIVAYGCFTVALAATAVAGKSCLNLLRIS
ncbi:hypothetical protein B0E52_05595 [Rhodanobacter sp. C06]|uniref:hypothetical protein n=1 Tax=Rhodanobacter sp. C06 TaxID=1945854 RepID=UPI0009842425|nr:hypothetical protein [Rhodanobacter sp. C06]OOG45206.1 hypothetical protein B0E52_05595 [Rhodanobacter sp. C06]